MDAEVIAERYAEALFETVTEDKLDDLLNQVGGFCDAMISDNLLQNFFASPIVPDENKEKTLKTILNEADFLEEFDSFLQILLKRDRFILLPLINKVLQKIIDEYRNVDTAFIYTPFELSESDQLRIVEKIGNQLGKQLRCKVIFDKTLLGGLIVKVDNNIYDLSLKSRLEKLAAKS